jgi:4-carboxymuconolactone decarboxylase
VRTGAEPELTDPVDRATAVAVRQLLTAGDVDDATWEAVVGALGQAGAVELTTLVGYYSLLAMHMRVLRVPLPDGAPEVDFPA